MPRLPQYDQPQIQQRPIGTPYNQVQPDRSGVPVADGLQQLGQGLGRASDDIARAQAEVKSFRTDAADLEMGRAINDLMHSAERGYMNRLRENALDDAPTLQELEKARERIAKNIPDPETQQRFNLRAGARIEQARGQMGTHKARETLSVFKSVAEGSADLAIQSAAKNPTPEGVNSAVLKALVAPPEEGGGPGPLRRFLLKSGLPTQAIEAAEEKFAAQAHAGALDALLSKGDATGAQTLLNAPTTRLGDLRDNYEKKVREFSDAVAVDTTGRAIVDKHTRSDGLVNNEAARAEVNAMTDARLRPGVEKRVASLLDEADQAKTRAQEQIYGRVRQDVVKRGGYINEANPDWHNLTDEYRGKLALESVSVLGKFRSLSQEEQKLQGQRNAEALAFFETLSPEAQQNVNVQNNLAFTGIDDTTVYKLQGRQKRVAEDIQKKQTPAFAEYKQTVKVRVADLPKADQKVMEQGMIDWRVDFMARNSGRPPTIEEIDRGIGEERSTLSVKRSFYGLVDYEVTTPAYKVPKSERSPRNVTPAKPPPGKNDTPQTDWIRVRNTKTGKIGRAKRGTALPPGVEEVTQ